MFRKLLDEVGPAITSGVAARHEAGGSGARQVLAKPGSINPHTA